jgi:uncharacterized protein
MTRVLLLALAVLVFIWLLRRALSARKPPRDNGRTGTTPVPELVACARCGVHLPKSEAISETDAGEPEGAAPVRFFCTREHLRLGPK